MLNISESQQRLLKLLVDDRVNQLTRWYNQLAENEKVLDSIEHGYYGPEAQTADSHFVAGIMKSVEIWEDIATALAEETT